MVTTLKDRKELRSARLSLRRVALPGLTNQQASAIASAWSRIGGLLLASADATGVDPAAALAVWNVESGPWPFTRGRPVLRFEAHKLWEHWGQFNPSQFDHHFRFGGHSETPGAAWTNQAMRERESEAWRSYHGSQPGEYAAFALAAKLAGLEAACLSSSFGGPQILGSNHAKLGYPNATALYRAFARSLRAQVLGFFDFCCSEGLLPALNARDWHQFARVYNGPGRSESYAEMINDAHALASAIVAGDGEALSRVTEKLHFDHEGFASLVQSLKLRHFTAREFLFRGRQHSDPSHAAHGLNGFPPTDLWPNLIPLARAVDAFRDEVGAPVSLTSVYRTTAYNAAVGGAPDSQHQRFAAIDFTVRDGGNPAAWAEIMRRIRGSGVFTGAIGMHTNAVHVDARGENVDV